MRPVLWGLLGFVVSLPLAFVLLIVAAARFPAMDTFTAEATGNRPGHSRRPHPPKNQLWEGFREGG